VFSLKHIGERVYKILNSTVKILGRLLGLFTVTETFEKKGSKEIPWLKRLVIYKRVFVRWNYQILSFVLCYRLSNKNLFYIWRNLFFAYIFRTICFSEKQLASNLP